MLYLQTKGYLRGVGESKHSGNVPLLIYATKIIAPLDSNLRKEEKGEMYSGVHTSMGI